MERLKDELKEAQTAMYLNEARLERSLRRLSQLEGDASEKASHPYPRQLISPSTPDKLSERECWIPVAFSRDLQSETLIPFELEGNPWVLFRSASGRPGCIYDECAHRACPLSLGQVKEGRLQCAYHGWEFSIKGECEKMPSCQFRKDVFVRTLPSLAFECTFHRLISVLALVSLQARFPLWRTTEWFLCGRAKSCHPNLCRLTSHQPVCFSILALERRNLSPWYNSVFVSSVQAIKQWPNWRWKWT